MPILLPNLPTLTKLIGEVTQEKVEILLTLMKLILEVVVKVLDLRLGRCISHLFAEFRKIFLGMSEIGLSVEFPAGFQMARYDLGRSES